MGERWRGIHEHGFTSLTPSLALPHKGPQGGRDERPYHRKQTGHAWIHHSVIASEATRFSRSTSRFWIASSLALLAMTVSRAPDAAQRASGALLIRGLLSVMWVPAQRRVIACRAASGTRKRQAIARHLLSRVPSGRSRRMKPNNSHRQLPQIFACVVGQITFRSPRVPPHKEGRFANRHECWRGMRWTPLAQLTSAPDCVR